MTGGSGFLGRHVLDALRRQGTNVRALARSTTAADVVRRCGAAPVAADVGDVSSIADAMAGCEAVVHAAAKVEMWGDRSAFYRVNVQGTEHVVAAALAAGVARLVHVSTEAVLAGRLPLVRVDESRSRPARPLGLYAQTKALAEDRVLRANSAQLATVVVRPRLLWGAGDTSMLPKMAEAARQGRFRWIGGGRFLTSTCHVRNAAEAVVLAAERGRGGAIYFVTDGPPVEFRRFVTDVLATQGVDPGARSLPRGLAKTIAFACELLWSVTGSKGAPPITPMIAKLLGEEVTLDDTRARVELGYVGRVSIAAGLEEMRAERARAASCPADAASRRPGA